MNTPEGSTNLVTLDKSAKVNVTGDEETYALTGLEMYLYIRKSQGQLCGLQMAEGRGNGQGRVWKIILHGRTYNFTHLVYGVRLKSYNRFFYE